MKKSIMICFWCDVLILILALLNPLYHMLTPLDKLNPFKEMMLQDIWILILAISLFVRCPIFIQSKESKEIKDDKNRMDG